MICYLMVFKRSLPEIWQGFGSIGWFNTFLLSCDIHLLPTLPSDVQLDCW